jgi:hypothetical protein
MKIQAHEIAMQSQHSFSKTELETSLSFSTICLQTQTEQETANVNVEELNPTEGFEAYNQPTMQTIYELIQSLLSMLQNKKNDTLDILNNDEQQSTTYHHMSLTQRFEENEKLDFSTTGIIQTDQGSINLDVNFSMSRSFIVENHLDIYSQFDPLVINLDGDIPDLSCDTFSFDLDNDGTCEQISSLGSRSGFLTLDKNADGIVNQGSELFGTLTGNGFEELKEYDEDNNNWIDENDSIFDKLQIWLKNGDENEKELVGLGEVGIGAIFLNSQTSEFTYKTQMNQTLGTMKSSGLFLNENGTVGNISQIDLAMRDTTKESNKEIEPFAQLLQA